MLRRPAEKPLFPQICASLKSDSSAHAGRMDCVPDMGFVHLRGSRASETEFAFDSGSPEAVGKSAGPTLLWLS